MPENFSLLVDFYELTMAQGYLAYKPDTWATFELFVRNLPLNRGYLVACGLEDILKHIRDLKFTPEDIAYLRQKKFFSQKFLRYLNSFKFRGDIWALREGEIFFANEPVVRVTAPIIEGQLLESYFLNSINLQTMLASKASRVVLASQGRSVFDFSLRRTHGTDAGIKAARCAYLAGCSGTSNVLAGKLFNLPLAGTMAHSFVMSFSREKESFLVYSRTFPNKTILLVDTYNVKKGIANAIAVGLSLKKRGHRLLGIRLDSGDLVSLSRYARDALDRAGLPEVKIFASGNLDEFKIATLIKKGACLDSFGVGTNMGTSMDAPCLDVIYKLSEVSEGKGRFLPAMKLSQGKATYPGRKQVFRQRGQDGRFLRDVLALEGEKIDGEPLLLKVVEQGRIVYQSPSLEEIRQRVSKRLADFSPRIKELHPRTKYPVRISPGLKALQRTLGEELIQRQ
jgi:nicotinate phosphoribosyltransferase